MRYKDIVQTKIDVAINTAELIKRGLENRSMTAQDTVANLQKIISTLQDTDNLVEKETQGLN